MRQLPRPDDPRGECCHRVPASASADQSDESRTRGLQHDAADGADLRSPAVPVSQKDQVACLAVATNCDRTARISLSACRGGAALGQQASRIDWRHEHSDSAHDLRRI